MNGDASAFGIGKSSVVGVLILDVDVATSDAMILLVSSGYVPMSSSSNSSCAASAISSSMRVSTSSNLDLLRRRLRIAPAILTPEVAFLGLLAL